MARVAPTVLPVLRATLDDPERVRERARELGVVRRQGKVDAYALVAVVVLGVASRGTMAIAQLGHALAEATGARVARSSFWDRFTPAFSVLLRSLLDDHVQGARARVERPPGPLRGFTHVLPVDATAVHRHDALAGWWRRTRRNPAKAALKVHAWVRAFTGGLVKHHVTADAHADGRAFGVDHALRGALVFFDRGDSSSSPWPWNRQVDELLTLRVRAAWGEHRHRVLLPDGERAGRLADPHRARVTSRGAMLVLGYPR